MANIELDDDDLNDNVEHHGHGGGAHGAHHGVNGGSGNGGGNNGTGKSGGDARARPEVGMVGGVAAGVVVMGLGTLLG